MRFPTLRRVGLVAAALLGVLLTSEPVPVEAEPAPDRATVMSRAARGWLAVLSKEQRALAALPFTHPQRERWQATPGNRVGLAWGRMKEAQQAAAEALLRSGLSEAGMTKFRGVRTLEGILRVQAAAQVRRSPSWRDPGLYWIAVFGTPAPSGTWSWRIEGHHFSRHFTCVNGQVSVTPAFHGANPARSRSGLRVLAAEEDVARTLLGSLDAAQRRHALVRERARDFLPAAPRDLRRLGGAGLPVGHMTPAQRVHLWRLIDVYIENLHPDLAHEVRTRVRATQPEAIRFSWMGSAQPGRSHGYRIHGPALFVEYWHGGNHIHSIWREPGNEYGRGSLPTRRGGPGPNTR